MPRVCAVEQVLAGLSSKLPFFVQTLLFSAYFIVVVPATLNAQPFGLTQRTTVSGLQFPLDDPGSAGTVAIARALPNTTFDQPVFITAAPDGTSRLFIVEKGGRIRISANSDSAPAAGTFLDIRSRVSAEGEQGLLGLAFDPNYSQSGYFYVYYNPSSGARRSVISRFHVSANADLADAASEQVVIQITQPANLSNHKGGMIAFGPDGMLYIALGDGGGGGDPSATGQNCTDMLASLLRIDPRGATPYQIPADNPFAGSGNYSCGTLSSAPSRRCGIDGTTSGQICKELFAVGLRNPWRFSFDRVTGALWLADVGQGAFEEVDLVRSGNNLGWPIFEGTANYTNPLNLPISQFSAPVLTYGRSLGYSITGGYVYRGSTLPGLYGKYIYGDYGSGNVWAIDYNGSAVVTNETVGSLGGVVSFGEDNNHELLAVSINTGYAYRFKPNQAPSGVIPAQLSSTGLFSNLGTLQITPGGIEFDVNAPLWSDNSLKRRWLLLPGTQRITFSATGAYDFPIGTAIVKHFELTLSPGVIRRLETRVLFRHNQGWSGYAYKWRANQSDADLLSSSQSESYTVADSSAPGGNRQQTWYYPSRVDCMSCHTSSSGRILGVRTRQLNRDFTYPAATDNQLRSWNNIGLFTANIGAHTTYESYPTYADPARTVESRARAYLAVNCAHCHQPAEARAGVIDLRYDTARSQMNLVDARPVYGDIGITNAYRIASGHPEQSVLLGRMNTTGQYRMPPIASNLIDQNGVQLMSAWIMSLGPSNAPPTPPTGLRILP